MEPEKKFREVVKIKFEVNTEPSKVGVERTELQYSKFQGRKVQMS